MSSSQILLPEAESRAPVIVFRSFDPNDAGGLHVLFPRARLYGSSAYAATDLHFLDGRPGRQSDCWVKRESKAKPCTSTETTGSGGALARAADGTVWLAFFATEKQHQSILEVVCPPSPHCRTGEPCRQPPCTPIERNARDTVQHRLFVVRLDADGRGARLGFRSEGVEITQLGDFVGPAMIAEGKLLHLVFMAGDSTLRRIVLDSSAMLAAPLPPTSLVVTETELQPEK